MPIAEPPQTNPIHKTLGRVGVGDIGRSHERIANPEDRSIRAALQTYAPLSIKKSPF